MGAAHALPAMHTLAMHTLHMNATAPCTVSKPPPDGTRDIAASAAACPMRPAPPHPPTAPPRASARCKKPTRSSACKLPRRPRMASGGGMPSPEGGLIAQNTPHMKLRLRGGGTPAAFAHIALGAIIARAASAGRAD